MKKTVVALVLCLAMVGLMAVPAVAAPNNGNGASKADILRPGDGTVVGFAVFNTNGNGGINVEVAVWNLPEGIYRLMVQAPSGPPPEYLGWLVVGADGEGNAHVQLADLVVEPGVTTIPCTVRINPNANPLLDVAHVEPAPVLVPLK